MKVLVSFVYEYREQNIQLNSEKMPCLAVVDLKDQKIIKVKDLYFPRLTKDFSNKEIKEKVVGIVPAIKQTPEFKRLPRFGVTGLASNDDFIFAGTWNGIYKLKKQNLDAISFLSHNLMSDPHGICVKGNSVWSIATPLDTVVETDLYSGEILSFFTVDRRLSLSRNNELLKHDWRFIGKQFRGAVGNWHFNHISIENEKVFLTSRLTNSLVEVDLKNMQAEIRTICWDTPVMIHDGRKLGGNYVFTSVDGKILICNTPDRLESSLTSMSFNKAHKLMQRDLVNQSIRMGDLQKKTINWCRGIEFIDGHYVTTTEGRYDQSYPFFNVTMCNSTTFELKHIKVAYDVLESSRDIKYMTGFAVQSLD